MFLALNPEVLRKSGKTFIAIPETLIKTGF